MHPVTLQAYFSEMEKLSASRGMKELVKRLGAPLGAKRFRGRYIMEAPHTVQARTNTDPLVNQLWRTEVAERLSKTTGGRGSRELWDVELEKELTRRAFSGRHGPREGEKLIPSTMGAERVADINAPRSPLLYRSGPVEKGVPAVATRHPDVAGNYALDRSQGLYHEPDGIISAIRRSSTVSKGEGFSTMAADSKLERQITPEDKEFLEAIGRRWPGALEAHKALARRVPTYEEHIIPRGNNSVVGKYKVRLSRTPRGDPALAISRVEGIPVEQAFPGVG